MLDRYSKFRKLGMWEEFLVSGGRNKEAREARDKVRRRGALGGAGRVLSGRAECAGRVGGCEADVTGRRARKSVGFEWAGVGGGWGGKEWGRAGGRWLGRRRRWACRRRLQAGGGANDLNTGAKWAELRATCWHAALPAELGVCGRCGRQKKGLIGPLPLGS